MRGKFLKNRKMQYIMSFIACILVVQCAGLVAKADGVDMEVVYEETPIDASVDLESDNQSTENKDEKKDFVDSIKSIPAQITSPLSIFKKKSSNDEEKNEIEQNKENIKLEVKDELIKQNKKEEDKAEKQQKEEPKKEEVKQEESKQEEKAEE